jgi:hypothetical protein
MGARRIDAGGGMMLESTVLAEVVAERWRPGIGDPTVLGWVTVAAYLVAALGSFWAAWREPRTDNQRPTRPAAFWLVLCGLLVALAINKQLDLQSLLTQSARDLLRSLGLYRQRRVLQVGFIGTVAVVCISAATALLWAARRRLPERWLALLGTAFIFGFVVVRAASFHHVDVFLAARIGGMKWNWVLELGGIISVAVSAFRVGPQRAPCLRRTEGSTTYRYRVNPP